MAFKYCEADRDQFDEVWQEKINKAPSSERAKWQFWRDETHYSLMKNELNLWVAYDSGIKFAELYTIYKNKETLTKPSGKTVYLRSFEIDEEHKSKGFFSKFIGHVLAKLKAEGYEYARIGVEIENFTNQGIYSHWGFVKQVKRLNMTNVDGVEKEVVILEKNL